MSIRFVLVELFGLEVDQNFLKSQAKTVRVLLPLFLLMEPTVSDRQDIRLQSIPLPLTSRISAWTRCNFLWVVAVEPIYSSQGLTLLRLRTHPQFHFQHSTSLLQRAKYLADVMIDRCH